MELKNDKKSVHDLCTILEEKLVKFESQKARIGMDYMTFLAGKAMEKIDSESIDIFLSPKFAKLCESL